MFAFALLSVGACGGPGLPAPTAGSVSAAADSPALRTSVPAGAWQPIAAVAGTGLGPIVAGSAPDAASAESAAAVRGPNELSWSQVGDGPAAVTSVAGLPDGGAVAGGRFVGTFGDLEAAGDGAGFVVSLTASGAVSWSAGLSSTGYAHVRAVAGTADGGAVATGYFRRDLAVSGAPVQRSAGSHDAVVIRFSPAGSVVWIRRLGGPGPDYGHGVALAPDGDVIVAGSFAGPVDFGDQQHQSVNDSSDGFVARLNGDTGATKWSARLASGFDDSVAGVSVGSDGDIAVAGTFASTGLLGGTPVEARGGDDVFVAVFDATGAQRWQRVVGSGGDDDVAGIARVGSAVVVAGSFPAPLYVEDGDQPRFGPAGDRDGFLVALAAGTGQLVGAQRFGGAGLDSLTAVAGHGDRVLAVGTAHGPLDPAGVPAGSGELSPVLLTWRLPQ